MSAGQHVKKQSRRSQVEAQPRQVWISLPELECRLGLTKATIYRMIRSGLFPRQVKLGAQAVRWHLQSVEQWEGEKLAQVRESAEV
jgi:prophage regulatory protein